MKALRNYLDKIKPNFEEGGKFHAFRSVFDGFETFLFVPNATSKSGTHIHDSIDSKRIMSMVVIALVPALLFGMYNVGYQHFHATGAAGGFWEMFIYGFLAVLPKIIVSYVVGLGIEFVVAQWKKEEIQEGFLVSGILIPMIVPVDCPLWILAVATAFSVIFAKEVFGGTGMNVFNVALITRAFLFFAYPTKMSGDAVWVSGDSIFGLGQSVDGLTVATPLGAAATSGAVPEFSWDMVTGLIPGSIGETSVIAIALGAILLLWTGIASWKTMFSVFVGGAFMAWVFNAIGPDTPMAQMPWYEHLVLGGFCFGAVFMATDPVTSARTETGKYIFGFLIGAMAIIIRVLNPGYPEGMMLAILLMNIFAPLIDYCVVQGNISRREKRAIKSMVVIVAFLLAFVSSSLRETQNKNVELDTKKQILAALNIKDVKDAEAEYNKYVKGDMLMNVDGTLTENTGAFATAYEKEAKENNRLHVFVAEVDGEKKYVFPVYGAGLWGAIWGYVALNSDKDTVYGVYFSHASETPGLGAEIASTHFQGEFSGKKTLENGEVVLGVVKNGKVEKPDYQVDGISGGTITSVGVDAMLKACLSSYKNFLTNNNEEE